MELDERVQTEWLILADAVQVVAGKLYLMGGGWDVLSVSSAFPVDRRCGIAVAFRVPWGETNRKIPISIEIASEDGQLLGRADGEIEVGRPPGIPQGASQLSQIALDIGLRFERAGTYVITAQVKGEDESRRFPFRVIAA